MKYQQKIKEIQKNFSLLTEKRGSFRIIQVKKLKGYRCHDRHLYFYTQQNVEPLFSSTPLERISSSPQFKYYYQMNTSILTARKFIIQVEQQGIHSYELFFSKRYHTIKQKKQKIPSKKEEKQQQQQEEEENEESQEQIIYNIQENKNKIDEEVYNQQEDFIQSQQYSELLDLDNINETQKEQEEQEQDNFQQQSMQERSFVKIQMNQEEKLSLSQQQLQEEEEEESNSSTCENVIQQLKDNTQEVSEEEDSIQQENLLSSQQHSELLVDLETKEVKEQVQQDISYTFIDSISQQLKKEEILLNTKQQIHTELQNLKSSIKSNELQILDLQEAVIQLQKQKIAKQEIIDKSNSFQIEYYEQYNQINE